VQHSLSNVIKKAFARSFDHAYFRLKPKKNSVLVPEYDRLDGKAYTPDAFYDQMKVYFDNPCAFYQDFGGAGALNLRDGVHPNQRRTRGSIFPAKAMLFDSPVTTLWQENNLVPFKWYRHSSKRSEVMLLFVPGWGRSNQAIEEMMCAQLQQLGIDAGLLTKPYHQARTPAGSYSGEYFVSANIFWTVANFRQLVAEIRQLVQYMRNHYKYVGLFGMSSGGFQSCLAANCEPVDFLFPFMTGSPTGSVVWNGIATQHVRLSLMERGVDEATLNKVWSIIDPGVLAHHCKAVHRKHYITIYDELVATEYQYRLWEALGKADKLELPTAHYSGGLMARRVISDVARFVNELTKTEIRGSKAPSIEV
jgi:hypothetical protein